MSHKEAMPLSLQRHKIAEHTCKFIITFFLQLVTIRHQVATRRYSHLSIFIFDFLRSLPGTPKSSKTFINKTSEIESKKEQNSNQMIVSKTYFFRPTFVSCTPLLHVLSIENYCLIAPCRYRLHLFLYMDRAEQAISSFIPFANIKRIVGINFLKQNKTGSNKHHVSHLSEGQQMVNTPSLIICYLSILKRDQVTTLFERPQT